MRIEAAAGEIVGGGFGLALGFGAAEFGAVFCGLCFFVGTGAGFASLAEVDEISGHELLGVVRARLADFGAVGTSLREQGGRPNPLRERSSPNPSVFYKK